MKKSLWLFCLPLVLGLSFPNTEMNLRTGKDYALFIAVQDYDHWTDLRNPVSDAQTLAKELKEEYHFSTEVVVNPRRNEIYTVLEKYRTLTYGDGQPAIHFHFRPRRFSRRDQ